ncbi:hypothetical protein PC116_g17060 [Phytophthora cactorum]|nr:hypothetical protein PC116_g17060 [Phytophthora cactorum]
MAERQYAEALAATEQAQSFERAGQAAQAVPLFQQALRILKRLSMVESAAQRARLQPTIAELTTRVAALQQSSDFLLAHAMEQHAAAREAEDSGSTKTDIVIDRYIAAAETYMQALNALPANEATARAALKEQLEYIIDYVSQLKAQAQTTQNQIQQQVEYSSDDVDITALQWPEPPILQHRTAHVTPVYASAAVRPVAEEEQKKEEKPGAAYTPQELDVLRRSSQINGHLFVPWLDDLDAQEKFSLPEPFDDPDGHVPLSAKQKKKEATWMRPSDYAAKCGHAPVMIAHGGVNPLVVKQDIVTDCSFVASLCIAAAYEQRFQKRLITNIIFPADPRTKQPVYNPFGNASSGQLLSSCTTRKNELWVSLIEKAYLKLNGGYDFPGGNSGIDLFALTGWIPERVPVSELIDAPSTEERLWEQLKSAFHYGDCIITMSTGDITKQKAKAIGLVPMHVYAVLNVYELSNNSNLSREGKKIRLLQVKNPWRKMSWKGPYSRHDKTRWDSAVGDELRAYQRQFYASEETESEEAGGQQDDGLFWIDFESVKQYFESLYMNWNPELFPYKGVCHEHWPVELGPVNDSLTLGFNPQYSLTFCKTGSSREGATAAAGSCTVWVLLSRHVSTIERDTDYSNQQFLTLHVYRGTPGKRVFYNHCAVSRGTYSNNPHTLVSLDLDLADDSEPCFTLVASQYEKFAALDYTLSIFSTRPFTCEPIPQFVTKSPTSIVIPGAWDSACAGGRPFYSAFMNNPQFHLQLQKPCRSLFLFLETEVFFSEDTKTASFPVNLRAALHTRERVCGLHGAGNTDSADDEPLKVLSSGVLGKFTLRVVSDPPAGASIAYRQIPSEGHGMELTRLRGKWDTQTGSAAGCSNYGCYTFNPKYLVHVIQECDILARLVVLEPEADAAPGESPTEGDSTAPPSINVSVFESTSEGDLLLSTNPKLAFAGATSARGVYHLRLHEFGTSDHPQNDDEQDMPKLTGQRATTKARHNRQQRYREKQRQYVDRLETTVKRLRMDVDQRLIKRLNIQRAAPIRPKASNVVACMRECMNTFESGTRDQQTQFLMSGTCSDVRFEDHIGREYILEQWADFACFLNEAAPMLEHCEFSADILDQDVSVGHVSALLVLRPTRRSLATLFPHCFSNMRLRDRMLQSPSIRLPMTVLFQFDEQGKVCRYAPTIDFVTGLYAVIRDYRDVASILESANINASGQICGGLSSVAMSQVGISYCGDNGHYRTETEPSCPRSTTSHVDKLSHLDRGSDKPL